MLVSITIKALNEERRIAPCIEAALAAVQGLDAEVIVVDSLSSDRTVDIARRYPVRVVQFERESDRCCGAAVELGWRHARGEFVYVLDADMLLAPGFVQDALDYLRRNRRVAGVGGLLLDTRQRTLADRLRAERAATQQADRVVDDLGGGGLYRRSAVQQGAYLAHRGLRAYEEAELGLRLRANGWALVRLARVAVRHEGYAESDWQMLRRLWRNGRAMAPGVLLRSAIGRPWFWPALQKFRHLAALPLLHGSALAAGALVAPAAGPGAGVAAWASCWAGVVLVMGARKRSLRVGAWHVLLWHYWATGVLRGLLLPRVDPLGEIPARELGTDACRAPRPANASVLSNPWPIDHRT